MLHNNSTQNPATAAEPQIIVIDLFCGAGGTTSGFENVEGVEVIACVNHDENAIMSHAANHPYAEHFIEDITEMYGMVKDGILFKSPQLIRMIRLVDIYRAFYPGVKLAIWASLECTNFSKAKGGGSKDADSRTLANHMDRYYVPLEADYLWFENVVEFMAWGPLTARVSKLKKEEGGYKYCEFEWCPIHGEVPEGGGPQPIIGWHPLYDAVPNTKKNGMDFLRWTEHIKSWGYHDNGGQAWKELNSADFGGFTSRNRLFGMFAKPGLPIVWPEATHEKVKVVKPTKGKKKSAAPKATPMLFDTPLRMPWNPVKEVLDFSVEGKSIFDRKKPLADKTLERIFAGLVKFVAGGKDNFLAKLYAVASNSDGVYSTDSTAHTITTRDSHAIVKPVFLAKYYSGRPEGKVISLDGPAGTITTIDGQALIQAAFLSTYNGGNPDQRNRSTKEPAGSLTTTNTHALVSAFIQKYHGTGVNLHSVDNPAPTLATKDQIGLMNIEYLLPEMPADQQHPCYIMRDFSNGDNVYPVTQPVGAVLPSPKLNLVTPFVMPTNYSNQPSSIDEPVSTITADRHWHYIVNPSHGGHVTSTEDPCPVVVARQDKAPLSLTVVDKVSDKAIGIAIRLDPSDSLIMTRIKIFMVMYNISDVKMRMLMITELLKIQGFRENYVLIGTQADKKKFIGNAVHPLVPEHMAKALLRKLREVPPTPKPQSKRLKLAA